MSELSDVVKTQPIKNVLNCSPFLLGHSNRVGTKVASRLNGHITAAEFTRLLGETLVTQIREEQLQDPYSRQMGNDALSVLKTIGEIARPLQWYERPVKSLLGAFGKNYRPVDPSYRQFASEAQRQWQLQGYKSFTQ